MKKGLMFIVLVCFQNLVFGQVTINITAVSSNTPRTDDIFIAGSFNNWNPSDNNFKLTKSGSSYSIILPAGSGKAEYKFTRGSWATVEGDANGNVITNRSFTYAINGVENIIIADWEDKKGGGGSASTDLSNV